MWVVDKQLLARGYLEEKKSVADIARKYRCSEHKINYWLAKHGIPKRSISEAIYLQKNPKGDPFVTLKPHTRNHEFLFGLGLGLYWGEGTKKDKSSVRLGNTDPFLTRTFLSFLRHYYGIDESRLHFGLQVFTDMDLRKEERFWQDFLQVSARQFYKTINTRSGSVGTYREKSKHGVLTIYFHNKKLRDLLVEEIERIKELS